MLKIELVIMMNYGFMLLKLLIIYFALIAILRILGKREVGELSIFDLVVLLIIADIASLGLDNDSFFIPSLVCLIILVVLQKVLAYILLHHAGLRTYIDGNPVILVQDGKLLVGNMKKEKYTIDDLVSQMRLEHIMDIQEIRLAVLETNGTLSIFRKEKFDVIRLPVICSGVLVKESFPILDITQEELLQALDKEDIDYKKVFYASYGARKLLYFYRQSDTEQDLQEQELMLQ